MKLGALTLDALSIPIEVGGPERRAKLTVGADGSLLLRAGAGVSPDELRQFVFSKRKWIYTKLAEKEELQHVPVERELVSGESFQYLGRNYRLQIVDTGLDVVRLVNGRLQMPTDLADGAGSPIVEWYRASGSKWVVPRVREWAERLRVEPGSLVVADLGHRWGSATADGSVRLHWAAFQLKPFLIDYVLAHELTHLREPHHGPAFWERLGRAMPDYASRKEELAFVGAGLWFGRIGPTC